MHAREHGITRVEATHEAQKEWFEEVVRAHEKLLLRGSKGWFTGYNSNVAGHQEGQIRYQAYFGGVPKYLKFINQEAADGYPNIELV